MSDTIEARLRRMNDELLMVGNDYSDVLLDAASVIEGLRHAQVAELNEARNYATWLFKALAPQCETLDTVPGLLTQIDNWCAGAMSDLADCQAEAEGLRADAETARSTCEWWEDGEMWESSCGAAYNFLSDGPAENEHEFCHKCGKRIVIDEARDA